MRDGLHAAYVFRKPAGPGAADISWGAKTLKDPAFPQLLQRHVSAPATSEKASKLLSKRRFGDC